MSAVRNVTLERELYRIEIITKEDKLILSCNKFEETFDKIYRVELSKEELQKEAYLVQFETLDLIKAFLLKRVDANTFGVKMENDNLILTINYKDGLDENKEIKFTLLPIKIEKDEAISMLISVVKELHNDTNILKKSNKLMLEDITEFKKDIKFLKEQAIFFPNPNASFIATPDELRVVYAGIRERIGRAPRGIKKLYQASLDGGDSNDFHEKCDGVNFTISIIQSQGGKRFGGFTTCSWDQGDEYVDDPKAFVFSLDKKKIYPYKNNGKAIWCREDYGPCFGCGGGGNDIRILGNCLVNNSAYTYETSPYCSYDYGGDKNALSEDGVRGGFRIRDCEVFKVFF